MDTAKTVLSSSKVIAHLLEIEVEYDCDVRLFDEKNKKKVL